MSNIFQVAPSSRILLVDGDSLMQRTILDFLKCHNMRGSAVTNRTEMLRAFAADEPDAIVIDLDMDRINGLGLLRDIRIKSTVPVILVSGSADEEIDQIVGLELGADDYIIKPFGLPELLARLRALLRRRSLELAVQAHIPDRRTYSFGGWRFRPKSRHLHDPDGSQVKLTNSQFALLSAFVNAPQRPLSRLHLLQATRVHEDVIDRSIDVQIMRLRRKIDRDADTESFIRTERNAGYTFEPEVGVTYDDFDVPAAAPIRRIPLNLNDRHKSIEARSS